MNYRELDRVSPPGFVQSNRIARRRKVDSLIRMLIEFRNRKPYIMEDKVSHIDLIG